jgi:hypothetical protein
MTFLETPEKLTVIGGAVATFYLPVGGFFWALFKANQEFYEHLERDKMSQMDCANPSSKI